VVDLTSLELPPQARRLDSAPLSDHVYRLLRDAICDGAFESHDHLVQNQIADRLGISRTPVRDALVRLAQEGLIHAVGQRGYVVTELTPRDVLDIYQVRMSLEVQAVDLAFPFISDAHIAQMTELNTQIAEGGNLRDGYELNRRFHAVLVDLCPNTLIRKILGEVWGLPVSLRIYRQHMASIAETENMVSQHRQITDAVGDRDRPALLDAVRRHLEMSRAEAASWLAGPSPPGQ
jgi:DNA-binding GntR family transcriptional regulator